MLPLLFAIFEKIRIQHKIMEQYETWIHIEEYPTIE